MVTEIKYRIHVSITRSLTFPFIPKTAHMKENEEFLRRMSLRYNVHIFYYVNGKLRKTLNFTLMCRIGINYYFTYVYILKTDMSELASNRGNGHDIQYGNEKYDKLKKIGPQISDS